MADIDPESIAGVAARLALWGSRAPKGLARVEFDSDFSRQNADALVRDACAKINLPFYAIELPQFTPAHEIVVYLLDTLAPLPHGVVSITGWATAFPADVDLLESLYILNLNRENLAQFPLCQIWWMTRPFADAVIRETPDLASWFIVRLNLTENIAASPDERPKITVPLASPEKQTAARKRSADLTQRFRNALDMGVDLTDWSDLANSAAAELRDVGLGKEAHLLSEDLLNSIVNTAAYQDYLSGNAPLRERDEARLLQNLANLYENHDNFRKAEEALDKVIKLTEKIAGPESNDVAEFLNNLAILYQNEFRCAEAESLFVRALAIREKTWGKEHPNTALSLNNLAGLYDNQRRFAEAESLYVRALAIREKALGPKHPETALSLNSLAWLYFGQGRFAEAEPMFVRALAILEKSLGPEHPNTWIVLENYFLLLHQTEQQEKAEQIVTRVPAWYDYYRKQMEKSEGNE